jgi:hypothetical protein
MGDNLAFNARYVMTGANDIKTSGESMKSAFESLSQGWHPTTALEAQNPAGTGEDGAEFRKWYDAAKKDLIDQGKEISGYVVQIAQSTNTALASFVKTDLESADDLKIEDL